MLAREGLRLWRQSLAKSWVSRQSPCPRLLLGTPVYRWKRLPHPEGRDHLLLGLVYEQGVGVPAAVSAADLMRPRAGGLFP